MSRFFTPKMKMSDLLSANYNLMLLLPRLGIKLGFGDSSVADVCRLNGVSATFVIMVCNCYSFDDYVPDVASLSAADHRSLVPYLVASHNYYVNERLPHIDRHLGHVASQVGSRYFETLHHFFADYRDEVVSHFAHEEAHVFPLLSDDGQGGQAIIRSDYYVKAHKNMVEKLFDLTQILFKYLPAAGLEEELNELVFGILQLSSDLQKHALIEERIVVPLLACREVGIR